MRFLTARRLALAAIVPALLVFSVVPGCSNQGEGERCGSEFGGPDSADCADGLVCVALQKVNRCCYPGQTVVHDSRCLPTTGNTGGSGGSTSGGTGGSDGSTSGGTGGSGGSTSGGTGGSDDAGTDDAATAGASDVGGGSN